MSAFVAVLKFLCMADTLSIVYTLFIYILNIGIMMTLYSENSLGMP